jgi:hypothetical protein
LSKALGAGREGEVIPEKNPPARRWIYEVCTGADNDWREARRLMLEKVQEAERAGFDLAGGVDVVVIQEQDPTYYQPIVIYSQAVCRKVGHMDYGMVTTYKDVDGSVRILR